MSSTNERKCDAQFNRCLGCTVIVYDH
jgi:hypothetical protein